MTRPSTGSATLDLRMRLERSGEHPREVQVSTSVLLADLVRKHPDWESALIAMAAETGRAGARHLRDAHQAAVEPPADGFVPLASVLRSAS